MALTYEPIATQTLSTAVADIYFNSIPQTYTDLILVMTGGCAANAGTGFRFNNDNGSNNYSSTYAYAGYSGLGSARINSQSYLRNTYYATWTTGLVHMCIVEILNYSNTTTQKSIISKNNGYSVSSVEICSGKWTQTSAINSINILTSNGNQYQIGSTFTLYGIKAA